MILWRTFEVGAVVEALRSTDAAVAAGADGMAQRVSRARLAATPITCATSARTSWS
jgi:hypothetical protein